MTVIGGIGFTAPWLLLALLALPILWLILRAIPPAPIRRRFPGVALLLGLTDDDTVSDRTPWWLLLLRMLAVAALIIGFAGPVLNPQSDGTEGDGPLLLVLDASWAGADGWPKVQDAIDSELAKAQAADRPVAILQLGKPEPVVFQAASTLRPAVLGIDPSPWQPGAERSAQALAHVAELDGFDTLWFGDGLDYPARLRLLDALEAKGDVRVVQSSSTTLGLQPATYADGLVTLTALRSVGSAEREIVIDAEGLDPGGNIRKLATTRATFGADETTTTAELSLPAELRARITRFEIANVRSAGATTLVDDSLRRREVALIASRAGREGLELLSPLHYLEQALAPSADLLTGALDDVLPANPDVIILADVAVLSEGEARKVQSWVDDGGLLLRFAGPRVAASDVSRIDEDPLMPVRLRTGGRTVGGAMSWGQPKTLAPFEEASPFYGLAIPEDVTITAQVVAQPDPTLAERVIASLSDGTPLVTRKRSGQGQIVLFHVTANAEWSSLPLSGLFVEMLERLAIISSNPDPKPADLEGTVWVPQDVMNAYGTLSDAGALPGVDGPDLVTLETGPDLMPGIYASGERRLARNVLVADSTLTAATWPDRIPVLGLSTAEERRLAGALLTAALVLLLADIIASLFLSNRLFGPRSNVAATVCLCLVILPEAGFAQGAETNDEFAVVSASEVVLAYVITGDRGVDDVSEAGLRGLSDTLYFRTSVEPANPIGVDLETDELAFFPILYWAITPDQPVPSDVAYAKLNAYLRSGGLILFDTRDADFRGLGASGPNGRKLQQLAAPLDIPALELLPSDHVLTRTFYLLQDFPGRHRGSDIWVEAAPPSAEQVEGMPFRNLNDGVTPVIIGGNDWAAAWAISGTGTPLLPVGRGFAGERQRELAYRFGVNLIMHVLTGNYKSDQVHVPALLDRLGQ